MWFITSIYWLLVIIGNELQSVAAAEDGCYYCMDEESCSQDLFHMRKKHLAEVPRNESFSPICTIIFDISGGWSKVIGRGLKNIAPSIPKMCYCIKSGKDGNCEVEQCECSGNLCNGQEPECDRRLKTSKVPGCQKLECYECNGVDNCSKDLASIDKRTFDRSDVSFNDIEFPMCKTTFNLTEETGLQVISRSEVGKHVMRNGTIPEDNCKCNDKDCSQEECICWQALCNGVTPHCSLRAKASKVPSCRRFLKQKGGRYMKNSEGCFVCDGVDACSKDWFNMEIEQYYNFPGVYSSCETIYDFVGEGEPKVIRRLFREWRWEGNRNHDNTTCSLCRDSKAMCNKESCICNGHLCNREQPDCKYRVNASRVVYCEGCGISKYERTIHQLKTELTAFTKGCYVCEGVESCSKNLAVMEKKAAVEYDSVFQNDHPKCGIKLDLSDASAPKVVSRYVVGHAFNYSEGQPDYCWCADDICSRETCNCYYSLCNGQPPDITFRANASRAHAANRCN